MKFQQVTALILSLAIINSAQSAGAIFDGCWWQHSEEAERTGFLFGLEDCYAFDAAPKLIFEDSWDNYRKGISASYEKPNQLNVPVAQVFKPLGRKQSGEEHAGMAQEQRYGIEFWRGNNDLARRGFLEAYITCPLHPARGLRLNKLDQYVQRLNALYNVGDKRGEDSPEFAGPVADALGLIQK